MTPLAYLYLIRFFDIRSNTRSDPVIMSFYASRRISTKKSRDLPKVVQDMVAVAAVAQDQPDSDSSDDEMDTLSN